MRALCVGGTVDNSELDLGREIPPAHTPRTPAAAFPATNLHHVGRGRDDRIAYAVYAAPDLADDVVRRVADERDYARRFEAMPAPPPAGMP